MVNKHGGSKWGKTHLASQIVNASDARKTCSKHSNSEEEKQEVSEGGSEKERNSNQLNNT